jgi:hypothetical protein
MNSDDVTAALAFNQDVRGGIEPAGTTIDLRVTAQGFFDAGGLGAAGQSVEPLAIERVAETLVQFFEPARLRLVLDHIVRLRDAL